MQRKKIEVFAISGSGAIMVPDLKGFNGGEFLLNGDPVNKAMKKHGFILAENDTLEFLPSGKNIIEYRNGDRVMSVKDYDSKRTYIYDDDSDTDILRIVANRKDKEGFEAVEEDRAPETVDIKVVGVVQDTGSRFISCYANVGYSVSQTIYTVHGRIVALDEYDKFSVKYAEHAQFGARDACLRYTRINGTSPFSSAKPFGENAYVSHFTSLDAAKAEEQEIRGAVRIVVEGAVFPMPKITNMKAGDVLSKLRMIKKLKTKTAILDGMSVLISELEQYVAIRS